MNGRPACGRTQAGRCSGASIRAPCVSRPVHPKGLQVHVRRPEGVAYTALGAEPLRCGAWGEPVLRGTVPIFRPRTQLALDLAPQLTFGLVQ